MPEEPSKPESPKVLIGESLSPGRVTGRLCMLHGETNGREATAGALAPAHEAARFRQVVEAMAEELKASAAKLESESMPDEAEILRTHVAMLRDPEFSRQVDGTIRQGPRPAEKAVEHVLGQMAATLAASPDPVMADRAGDFRDLARELKARLIGGGDGGVDRCVRDVTDPILAATELLTSMVLRARETGVRGFIVCQGTGMSHGAILAKSFGLPTVRVQSLDLLKSARGKGVLVDADGGRVVVEPSAEHAAQAPPAGIPAWTRQQLPAKLWLSIVDPAQLDGIEWAGLEGVGLYRTETLFMQHVEDFPDEAEQYRTYRRLFQHAGRRPVVVRTADLGADKPVAHMSLGPQINPYLGLRAHRIFHFHPEILVTQARAILRAAAGDHDLRLMFPMLEMIEQWDFVQRLIGRAVASLKAEGTEFQEDFQQGVLIETPSAVLSFPEFLDVVDFVSVGTNDLVQYLFAVERDAVNVADLYLPEHPIVLRCIRSMVKRARAAGKPLSICGEIAADPALAEVLVGLGVENLSMSYGQAQTMGRHLADVTAEHCKALARQCLWARTAEEVREHLNMKPRAEMDQMAETLPEGHAVDPVCGMIVHTRASDFTLERFGRRFFFCSLRCMRRFDRENPEPSAPSGAD